MGDVSSEKPNNTDFDINSKIFIASTTVTISEIHLKTFSDFYIECVKNLTLLIKNEMGGLFSNLSTLEDCVAALVKNEENCLKNLINAAVKQTLNDSQYKFLASTKDAISNFLFEQVKNNIKNIKSFTALIKNLESQISTAAKENLYKILRDFLLENKAILNLLKQHITLPPAPKPAPKPKPSKAPRVKGPGVYSKIRRCFSKILSKIFKPKPGDAGRMLGMLRSKPPTGGAGAAGWLGALGASLVLVDALGTNCHGQETSDRFYAMLNDPDYKAAFPDENQGEEAYGMAWSLYSRTNPTAMPIKKAMLDPNIYPVLTIFALYRAQSNRFDRFSVEEQREILHTFIILAKKYPLELLADRFTIDEYLDTYKWYCKLDDKIFKNKYPFEKFIKYFINIPDDIYKTITFEDKLLSISKRKYFWIKYDKEHSKDPFNEYNTINGMIKEIIKDRKTDYTRG